MDTRHSPRPQTCCQQKRVAHETPKYMALSLVRWPGYNVLRPVFALSRILTRDTGIDS